MNIHYRYREIGIVLGDNWSQIHPVLTALSLLLPIYALEILARECDRDYIRAVEIDRAITDLSIVSQIPISI